MMSKWDSVLPWHEETPPTRPHLLQTVSLLIKDSNIKPVLAFDVFFNEDKAVPSRSERVAA